LQLETLAVPRRLLGPLAAIAGIVAFASIAGAVPPWQGPTPLTANTVIYTSLASSGDTLHMVYQRSERIFYRRSAKQGEDGTWTKAVNLGPSTEIPLTEPLASSGSNLHLVFARGDRLFYKRSLNGGASWEPDVVLATGHPNYFFRVSIDASGPRIHVAWVTHNYDDFSTTGLFYRRSLDNGKTWQRTQTLARASGSPGRPALSVVGAVVHLAWTDERDGNARCYTFAACPEIYYKRSPDSGVHWGSDQRMTNGDGNTLLRPDVLALANGNAVLVWQDDHNVDGQEDIYVRHSGDRGLTWSGAQRLTFTPETSNHAMLTGSGSTVVLAWADGRTGVGDVYARVSTDGGATWGSEEQVTSTPDATTLNGAAMTSHYGHLLVNDGERVFYARRAR
jgi:BNR repeat protein